MHTLRRLVWWKCVFWVAVGYGCGTAAALYWPEPGVPAGATRVSVERLVAALAADAAGGDGVANLVVYPRHQGVRLLTYDLRRAGGSATAAFTFANEPFLTAGQLKGTVAAGRRAASFGRDDPSADYAGRLSGPADRAIADVMAQPDHRYASVTDVLDHGRRPTAYTRAWWAERGWRYDMPVAVGVAIVGGLGAWLTRRSPAEVAAADLLRRAPPAPAPAAAPVGLSQVEALDALLVERLEGGAGEPGVASVEAAPAGAEVETTAATPAVVRLRAEPVPAAAARAAAEEKSYAGEFYPTVRPGGPKGFSLVEVLVAIAIIGILTGLLLPALAGARQSADTIACAANLHAIGQGLAVYLEQNQNTFPPAYLYIGHSIVNGVQTPTQPSAGYVHWSSYLYGTGAIPLRAFTCPAMRMGGLPPTNTPPGNRDPGQQCPSNTVVDQQAPRLAYTVNEALCPRNKFVTPAFGGSRVYRFVKATEVARSADTVMATEMIDNVAAVSYDTEGTGWVMSHRPVSGFLGVDGELDMYLVPVGAGFRGAAVSDLDADPNTLGSGTHTRLDLVGRNHGKRSGYPDRRLSNFLYVDGHVRTQSVYDTVRPFQWGDEFYSLVPNDDLVRP